MQVMLSTQGHEILVDSFNYGWLNSYLWGVANGYARRAVGSGHNRVRIFMAREVLSHKLSRPLLPYPQELVDHADRNKLNNQEANLRIATFSQNTANQVKNKGAYTSKCIGVSLCTGYHAKPWRAGIAVAGRVVTKYFVTEVDAALCYDSMARELHGEFAVLNFPEMGFIG